jgi:hypothetical protein
MGEYETGARHSAKQKPSEDACPVLNPKVAGLSRIPFPIFGRYKDVNGLGSIRQLTAESLKESADDPPAFFQVPMTTQRPVGIEFLGDGLGL